MWECVGIYRGICSRDMGECVWMCEIYIGEYVVRIWGNVCGYVKMYGNVCGCVKMCGEMCGYIGVFGECVGVFLPLSQNRREPPKCLKTNNKSKCVLCGCVKMCSEI